MTQAPRVRTMALKMHGLTHQSLRDLNGCRKNAHAESERGRSKTPQPTLEATSRLGGLGIRGAARTLPGPRPARRGPEPLRVLSRAPGLLLRSSTHQELQHDVSEEGENGSVNSVGRTYPASPDARGGPT